MLKGYIQNMLVSALGDYVEDFTANDIQIDQWNGRIIKENVKLKSSALDWLFRSLLQAPCQIVQGYIKKMDVEVPWSQILSKSIVINISEVHIILKSSDHYNREFVKSTLHSAKMQEVKQLLEKLKSSIEGQVKENLAKDTSYLGKVTKIIYENLKFFIRKIHIRFEDTKVSRCDQAFNFGIVADSVSFLPTNNRFSPTFINIDDKIIEQKSFSQLNLVNFSMYWNSNALDNWTKNKEFINLTAQGTIDFSSRHVDNLWRKHLSKKQDYSNNTGVYLIQPCSCIFYFRTNLAPNLLTEIPHSTTFWKFTSEITVTIDEEVYKDTQYLTKFFAWHANSVNKKGFLKFRPAYNCSVIGNTTAFWKYAINATIYLRKKENQKNSGRLKVKRAIEKIQLGKIYKNEQINKYLKERGRTERQLSIDDLEFQNETVMAQKRIHLEHKFEPSEIVRLMNRSDVEAQSFIEEFQNKHSWSAWVPTQIFSSSYWQGTQHKPSAIEKANNMDAQMAHQLEELIKKSSQIDKVQKKQTDNKSTRQITSCFIIQAPVIQVLVVNKLEGVYDAKCFMSFITQDYYFQSVSYNDLNSDYFSSIKNFEITDKLVQSTKFSKVIYKKPVSASQTTIATTQQKYIQSFSNRESAQTEIDGESDLNINNGLPIIKDFSSVQRDGQECSQLFMLFQLSVTHTDDVKKYRVDLLVNPIFIFYNRALIAHIQTFLHQAMLNKVHNAAAEADFDERVQALQKRTEQQVSEILKKSVFEVACTLNGIELLMPDYTNFEQARYLILQTGNIILRSKQPQLFSHKLDTFFESCLDLSTSKTLTKQLPQSENKEEFLFSVYGIQLLYIPQIAQLESVLFDEISKADIDRQFNIFRTSDFITQITKVSIQDSALSEKEILMSPSKEKPTQFLWVDAHIANLDFQTTTKEIKELKQFTDRFQIYHKELSDLVEKEFLQMQFEQMKFEAQIKKAQRIPKSDRLAENIYRSANNLMISKNSIESVESDDDFYDANENFNQPVIQQPRLEESKSFTQQINNRLINSQSINNKPDPQKQSQKSNIETLYIVQAQVGKLKIQVLEAQSMNSQELVNQKSNKGIPFLTLELVKTTFTLLIDHQLQQSASFTMKQFCILNIEKQSAPQVIARSNNFETADIPQRKESIDQSVRTSQGLIHPEDEDNIVQAEHFEDDMEDYFIRGFIKVSSSLAKLILKLGQTELELTDFNMRKLIETLALDWPQTPITEPSTFRKSQEPSDQISKLEKNVSIQWDGSIIKLRVKKDISTLKIDRVSLSLNLMPQQKSLTCEMSIDDFQIKHQGEELVYRYNFISLPDEDINFDQPCRILTLKFNQEVNVDGLQQNQIKLELINMLVIAETSSILLIVQNINTIVKTLKPITSQSQLKQQSSSQVAPQQSQLQVQVIISGCHLQIPTAVKEESKNSLFIHFDNLKLNKMTTATSLEFKQFSAFVAKNIDQEQKYYLLKFQNIALSQENMQQVQLEIGLVQFTFNENFIVFLSNMVEYHFDHVIQFVQFIQKHQPVVSGENQQSIGQRERQQVQSETSFIYIEDLDQIALVSDHMKSVIATQKKKYNVVEIQRYIRLQLKLFEVQWVIGMSFENHEESYVTLNNRKISKIVLDQFELKKEDSGIDFLDQFQLKRNQSNTIFSESQSSYDKLLFKMEGIQVETTQAKDVFNTVQVQNIVLEQSLSSQVQKFLMISETRSSPAVVFNNNNKNFQVTISLIDLRICKQNAHIVSTIVKNAYSCKNAIVRGKKRKIFQNLFGKSKTPVVEQLSPYEIQVKIKKLRVVCFENIQVPVEKQPSGTSPGVEFINTMTAKAIGKFTVNDDTQQFKKSAVIVIEAGFQFSNKQSLPGEDFQEPFQASKPESHLNFVMKQLQMYLNSNHTSVADLIQGNERRLMILYPVDIELENQFYSQKNLNVTDVFVSMVELELSFKQIFFLMLLSDKILLALKPITQILEHIEQQTKRGQKADFKPMQSQSKKSTILELKACSIYFALIKETQDKTLEVAYQSSTGSAMPLLSLEVRSLQMTMKSQVTGLKTTEIIFPFELYYFNQKLSFFEPSVERVLVKYYTESGRQDEKSIQQLEIKDVLNLNFSVALYENLFVLVDNLKDEFNEYTRQIEIQKQETVIGSQTTAQTSPIKNYEDQAKSNSNFLFSPSSYFIKNKTGELLMFMASKKPAYTELQPNEILPLDFQKNQFEDQVNDRAADFGSLGSSRELFEGVDQPNSDATPAALSTNSDEDDQSSSFSSDDQNIPNFSRGRDSRKPRSPFRRGQFRFKKSEPNRVQLQVTIKRGVNQLERTLPFDINFDTLTCQRYYLDEHRQLYVICQTQVKDGQKYLIIRSPMQVTNNLQIPIEVQLLQPTQSQAKPQSQKEIVERKFKLLINNYDQHFSMVVKPGASQIIPLKACNFDNVQIRPIIHQQSSVKQDSQFEWSEKAQIKLLQDEAVIFEQKPIVCHSIMSKNNRIIDRNNNQVYFVLNSNTYSIRSFIDFNTQQTEFFSLRYLSITAPFTIQNLIPVPITMIFKNILREKTERNNPPYLERDNQLYDLSFKHNSSLQVLYLNPLGNFDFSVTIPGFQNSNFMPFKLDSDDDFKLSTDLLHQNYIEAGFEKQSDGSAPAADVKLQEKAQWRFVKQKRLLLQLCSQFQSQFNICMSISFIQGFYHISFYAKYWFLNNTQMPLLAQVIKTDFSFPTLELPYQSTDFDFETVKHFQENDQQKTSSKVGKMNEEKFVRARINSGETIITETALEEKKEIHKPSQSLLNSNPLNLAQQYSRMKHLLGTGNEIEASESKIASYNPGSLMMRLRPWECYKGQQATVKAGILAAINQEDIDRVSSIYFIQEGINQEQIEDGEYTNGQLTSGRERTDRSAVDYFTIPSQVSADDNISQTQMSFTNRDKEKSSEAGRRQVQFDATVISQRNQDKFVKMEKMTKISRSTIQVTNFNHQLYEQQSVPLNHTPLSNFDLFPAPLNDQNQLKRIILFSDVPTEELTTTDITKTQDATTSLTQSTQILKLKICESEWCSLPFDMAKLQSEPIKIKDTQRNHRENQIQPQSLFEIVSVVSYLPQPFSYSKLICFQPRYLMVNRTYQLVTVVQAQCEEQGSFKIFAQETSVFHWTDASKPLEICIKVDDHEFSGNMRLDNIGEVNLRLKSSIKNDNFILNVSISEETNSFYIVFSDVSYAPPYRLENLTKSRFKIQQTQGRHDDFDQLNAFQTMSFAWSYPLQKKMLKISLCHLQSEEDLGIFDIDQISKNDQFTLKDRQNKRNFILEITNEKTIKVVRIIYPKMVVTNKENQAQLELKNGKIQIVQQNLMINRLGLSIVNSQARELCYMSISNLRFKNENTQKYQKVILKAGDVQIDNQLSRSNDAIILKRESTQRTVDFFTLKIRVIKNEAIENLLYIKQFVLDLVPFQLSLDGNFCDESYKYGIDVLQLATKYAFKTKHREFEGTSQLLLDTEFDPTAIRPTLLQINTNSIEDDQMKSAINELKKKGQPYLETGRDVQKIYFEQFQINEIRFNFTFSSSQILFREFTMNPTLKFFIVLFSNLKNVKLRFSKFQMLNQHLLASIFLAQMRRFYWHEVTNHAQILKIVTSMGIFGNISDTIGNLASAFKSLIYRPFDSEENKVKAIILGSIVFMKDSVVAVSGSVSSILDTLRQGLTSLVQYSLTSDDGVNSASILDKDLFEDDINMASRPINNHFSTPLSTIDTQNRIWLKIITREKQNYDVKKRLLRKHQQAEIQPSYQATAQQSRSSYLYQFASLTVQGVLFIPKKIIQTSAGLVNIFLEEDVPFQLQKVRPPRFVSFTMEMEPYSKKKAFALEILNEINLNVIEAETIQKLYTMSQTVVIMSGKRIICVEEQQQRQSLGFGLPNMADSQQQISSNGMMYKHWNVFFKDILRVGIDIIDKDHVITPKDFQKALVADKSQIYVVLKVHYMINEEPQVNSAANNQAKSLKMGLLDEMTSITGFKVARRDIKAKIKDLSTIKRIYDQLIKKLK